MPEIARIFVLDGAVDWFKAQAIEINTPFELYIDERVRSEFFDLYGDRIWKQKFYRVIAQMMNDRFGNSNLYGREPNGTTAMKISVRQNSRLICVEQHSGKIVIMAHVEENKTRMGARSRKTEGAYDSIPKRVYTLIHE